MNHEHMDPETHTQSDPCTDKLTDIDYLKHMIPHHQVAIDMSQKLLSITKNPKMLYLCNEIIRIQGYEIWEMSMIKQKMINTVFSNDKSDVDNTKTTLDMFYPIQSKSLDGSCSSLFFNPDDHSKHMETRKLTDKSYLEHMIPHHQVAIDMSKRLLLHTNNSYLLDFCRKLIIDQQGEIFYMNNLLQNKYNYESELI